MKPIGHQHLKNEDFKFAKNTKMYTEGKLLFIMFTCPHCSKQNVLAKEYKHKVLLCFDMGCRKIIVIENITEAA